MVYNMSLPPSKEALSRCYTSFRGVDFLNPPHKVNPSRSPDSKNMIKDYDNESASCIKSRKGYMKSHIGESLPSPIYQMINFNNNLIIHAKNKLYRCTFSNSTLLTDEIADSKSSYVIFAGNLYIFDGSNIFIYDQEELKDARSEARLNDINFSNEDNQDGKPYIPTTRIGANPDGSKGQFFQSVNLIQPKQINSFRGDGESTVYNLNQTMLDTASTYSIKAFVNGELMRENEDFVVNRTDGKITFDTAPSRPPSSDDNVIICFSKTIDGYEERIYGCITSKVFDNRVFLSTNPKQRGTLFHSEFQNPLYYSDNAYYNDGNDNSHIVNLIEGSGELIAIKSGISDDCKVYVHTPSLDHQYGKVYPVSSTQINMSGIGVGTNFLGEILYLTDSGLYAIIREENGYSVQPRSSLINPKLVLENGLERAVFQVYDGYLMIFINNKVYLADSRGRSVLGSNVEYEYFYWDNFPISDMLNKVSCTCILNDMLYFATTDGNVYLMDSTSNNGEMIEAYWTTPKDDFSYPTRYKSTNKKGSLAIIERSANSKIKIAVKTDKDNWKEIFSQKISKGFDFSNFSFNGLSFTSETSMFITFKPKKKKFKHLSYKIYSDELNKPFGVYEISTEVFVNNYIKN